VLLVEASERLRERGRLSDAEDGYRRLARSPTVAQELLGLLGLGEVQRAEGLRPVAALHALERSRATRFGYGEVHAAVTLGLAGVIDKDEAERIVADSAFPPPERGDADGLLRFCTGPDPTTHALHFP